MTSIKKRENIKEEWNISGKKKKKNKTKQNKTKRNNRKNNISTHKKFLYFKSGAIV